MQIVEIVVILIACFLLLFPLIYFLVKRKKGCGYHCESCKKYCSKKEKSGN